MHSAQPAKHVLSIAAAATLLASCSNGVSSRLAPGANSPDGTTGVMHNGHLLTTSVLNPRFAFRKNNVRLLTHPLHGKIDSRSKTFWISDSGDNDVQIFTLPSGTYIGAAPAPPEGFSEPQGMCSDKAGDVFVANTSNSTIDEYAGNGTFMQALSDPGEFPAGCSVDPSSGTLAVSNIISTSGGAGGISLYEHASGKPRQLTDPNMFEVFFLAYYGRTGKLYYSGFNNSFDGAMSSYVDGKFKPFVASGLTFSFPGSVSWADKTKSLAIYGQGAAGSAFYHVKANGSVTGSTTLSCPSGDCDVVQATVKGHYIVAPDAGSLDAGLYRYPAGGDALVIVTGFGQPIGSAVSSVDKEH